MAVIRKDALSFKCGNFAKRYPDHEATDLLQEAEGLIAEMESEIEELRANAQDSDLEGYRAVFFAVGQMLGLPAQSISPKRVWETQMRPALEAAIASSGPIPMVLHCPRCHVQHIDAPDERTPDWKNPPHRSHLCHGCGLIWRPADVPTIGVERTQTTGKSDAPFTMPLLTVDLGQFRDAVMHAYGVIELEEYCVKLGELLDLIDAKAVVNGQSVGMDDLEQILLDPENQPSQFGTVPTELLEKCEEMISDLVHQFGDRGCTCTFPEADCCAYARAEHYSRDGAAHG